jgi:N-acetylglucosaminyldiphosphoundecaprenol N-acetyl-beta-D-mannosaminyltransferase
MRVEILGVPIDAVTCGEARRRVSAMLDEQRFHLVTTPNPEMLVKASTDTKFRHVLQEADLNIPDGFGLILVARTMGKGLPERVAGSDFTTDVCALATEKNLPVFFLGGELPRVAERAAEALKKFFPELVVAGAEGGGKLFRDSEGHWRCDPVAVERIRSSGAAIVLTAFPYGAQECWLRDNAPDLPSVRLGMGVGGTFNFLAGELRRAPAFVRRIGLEWAWRLAQEPSRWCRIWTAVAVFPWLVWRSRNGKMKA